MRQSRVMWILVPLGLVLGWALMAMGVGYRRPARAAGPALIGRTVLYETPPGSPGLPLGGSAGLQMLVAGERVWIAFTTADAQTTRVNVVYSPDGGTTVGIPVALEPPLAGARMRQASLAMGPEGVPWLTCLVHEPLTAAGDDRMVPPRQQVRTGVARYVLPEGDPFAWRFDGWIESPEERSLASPMTVVGFGGTPLTFYLETEPGGTPHLMATPTRGVRLLDPWRIDDAPDTASVHAYDVVVAGEEYAVTWVDDRLDPQAAHLYAGRIHVDVSGIELRDALRLDPPIERAWQRPPRQFALDNGGVGIASSWLAEDYLPAAYQQKLRRHRVGGLYQVMALSREPQLWIGTSATRWQAHADISDQTTEIVTGGTLAEEHAGAFAMVWTESIPSQQMAEIKLAWTPAARAPWSASVAVNALAPDADGEALLDFAWLADGTLAVLYSDLTAGSREALILARFRPPGE